MKDDKHIKMVALKGKSNWYFWNGHMINYLFTKDLYDIILGPLESSSSSLLLSATSFVTGKTKAPVVPHPLPTLR